MTNFIEPTARDDLDLPADLHCERLLDLHEVHRVHESKTQVDNEIEVALRTVLAARNGSENGSVEDAAGL